MLGKKVVVLAFLFSLFTVCAQAVSYELVTVGPETVSATGSTYQVALALAQQEMNDWIDDYEDDLPPGGSVLFVNSSDTWDGTTCTIEFRLLVENGL